jgi:hypothetical protein
MHCKKCGCNHNRLKELSKYFWCGTVSEAIALLVAQHYFNFS